MKQETSPSDRPREVSRATADKTVSTTEKDAHADRVGDELAYRAQRVLKLSHYHHWLLWLVVALLAWFFVSYVMLPNWWENHESHHPALINAARITVTAADIPGDPLNIFIVGSQKALVSSMLLAGWHPADPVTLETSIRIVESSVFHRPYDTAPVSNLFLFGRKEDLAFERPVGDDPRQRHHVRFWQAAEKDELNRPAWWGAVTYDRSIGVSHTTGQITHHIAGDVDKERDLLMSDLRQASAVESQSLRSGFQEKEGRNGAGDQWFSDGKLGVVELKER